MSTMRQTPLTCSGHTRPVVHLSFSEITEHGYFMISACKGSIAGFCKYYIGSIGRKCYIGGVTTPGTRQKTMLEAKKRLNFNAEVWQLPHNRPNCVIYYRDRE